MADKLNGFVAGRKPLPCNRPFCGHAGLGVLTACDHQLLVSGSVDPGSANPVGGDLVVESLDEFRAPLERRFYDWVIGVLEDAGVVGILRDDYVYQASSFHGKLHVAEGVTLALSLTRYSVEFLLDDSVQAVISFDEENIENEEAELEASQVHRAFGAALQRTAMLRAWVACTPLASNSTVLLKNLRVHAQGTTVAMDVSTDLADFTITVRRSASSDIARYVLSADDSPIFQSLRVSDAVLCDVAEDAGGDDNPATIVLAMMVTSEVAHSDPLWALSNELARPHG